MISEFIRLHPAQDDDSESLSKRVYVCELPAAVDEEQWLDCGRVIAFAAGGVIRRVDVRLNEVFLREIDDPHYDPEEVLSVILLWLGWESWLPMGRVRVNLYDGTREYHATFLKETTTFVSRMRIR